MNLALFDLDNTPRSGLLRRRLTCRRQVKFAQANGRSHNTRLK